MLNGSYLWCRQFASNFIFEYIQVASLYSNKLAEPELYYVLNNCNWFIWARASSYVTVTSFIYVRSCNCYSMGIKAIIHSTSLHYGRVSGFSLWANDLLLVYGFIVFCMAWPARCSHVVMPSPIAPWGKFPIFGAFSSSILILNYGRYTFFFENPNFS